MMTENDYIAEYIKEKFPQLLGVDFGFWKTSRIMSKTIRELADNLSMQDSEKEVQDEDCD